MALFSLRIFLALDTIALPFVFDNYCPIVDVLSILERFIL